MAESNDQWEHYVAVRDRFITLMRSLDDAQANTTVPMCPDWTVVGVAAHACGLNLDLTNGMREGLGSDESTARQVADRADCTLEEICVEWLGYDAEMKAISDEIPLLATRLAGDLVVHLHDVQHALGHDIDRHDDASTEAAHRYVEVFQQRLGELLGIGATVELSDGTTFPAHPELEDSGLVLQATPFDFVRSYTGRRSRRQVESLLWSADPTIILDEAWGPYGDFQVTDIED
ncbi:MAG: hypothetical protein GY708_18335 [Actinomycetia bacterium]|nr:hypothetical protein [Actinomycetes bacterium]MCP4963254.1 hypothetical protein [Actinomycetes bacterium]